LPLVYEFEDVNILDTLRKHQKIPLKLNHNAGIASTTKKKMLPTNPEEEERRILERINKGYDKLVQTFISF